MRTTRVAVADTARAVSARRRDDWPCSSLWNEGDAAARAEAADGHNALNHCGLKRVGYTQRDMLTFAQHLAGRTDLNHYIWFRKNQTLNGDRFHG
jgi:hypothetical protein